MHRNQQLAILVLCFITNIYAQQSVCSCSCCLDYQCIPILLPNINVQACDLSSCLAQCRTTYPTCRTTNIGVITAQCLSIPQTTTTTTRTTTKTAVPTGMTTQYPQTANLCSCSCCPSNSNCPSRNIGVAWSSVCSAQSCDQSCRNQYSSSCLGAYLTGTCLSNNGASTFCDCRCCTNNQQCIDYRINTDGNCGTCSSVCQNYSPCQNTNNPTITVQQCNHANRSNLFTFLFLVCSFFFLF